MYRGECRFAESFTKRFCGLAQSQGDAADLMAGDRMMGILFHYLGDQVSARGHIEHVLRYFDTPSIPAHAIGFVVDERVVGQSYLARILWLQGCPEQAIDAATKATEIARSIRHDVSLCYSLAAAVGPVALWEGDLSRAQRTIAMLLDRSSRDSLRTWNAWGLSLKGVLLIEKSMVIEGLQLLGPAIKDLRDVGNGLQDTSFLGEFAKGLGRAGKISEGLDAINEALDLSEKTEERWYTAELLGIKGDLLLLQGKDGTVAQAEDQFERALNLARSQGALSFELRSAMRLFGLKRKQNGGDDASALLKSVYDRFSEGFGTADLKKTKALLDQRETIASLKNANSRRMHRTLLP
ncbi:MAG: hypothetical protein WBX25_30175 [Rhodomicrobium sp.]